MTIVILFGVSGCGKTPIAQALAIVNNWQWFDADDLHAAANRAKMSRNEPLTDADRLPWLHSLHDRIQEWLSKSSGETCLAWAIRCNFSSRSSAIPILLSRLLLSGCLEIRTRSLAKPTGGNRFIPAIPSPIF